MIVSKIGNKLFEFAPLRGIVFELSALPVGLMENQLNSLISGREIFFILGMGRSGTTFISALLEKSHEISSFHESFGDRDALVNAYWNKIDAREYVCGYRKALICSRLLLSKQKKYCEVNSYLRYHVDYLKEAFCSKVFHLVRDGRLVVRSMMNRKTLSGNDKGHSDLLSPQADDPLSINWSHLDRFQRVCWYWNHANTFLLDRNLLKIRLEDVTESYELLKNQVLSPLGISIPYRTWKEETHLPKNIGTNKIFPGWTRWTLKQKKNFEVICGKTMEKLGYRM
jgi:hypothetical protein